MQLKIALFIFKPAKLFVRKIRNFKNVLGKSRNFLKLHENFRNFSQRTSWQFDLLQKNGWGLLEIPRNSLD